MLDALKAHLEALPVVASVEVSDYDLLIRTTGVSKHSFRVAFSKNFPLSLPRIFVQNPKEYAFFPHVSWAGEVCIHDGQAVSIDTTLQQETVERVLLLAVDVLNYNKGGGAAFWDEFEGYWNNQEGMLKIICFLEPGNSFLQLEARIGIGDFPTMVYKPPWNDDRFQDITRSALWTRATGVVYYCPLEKNYGFPQPRSGVSLSELKSAIGAMSKVNQEAFWDCLNGGSNSVRKRKFKSPLNLLLSQPRPKGGRSLVAVSIPYGHQILNGNPELFRHGAFPCRVHRLTDEYTTRRCGGDSGLSGFRVGVLGVGALGSVVAKLLVSCGVRKIWLCDHDEYTTDNILRHELPAKFIGVNKAQAMALHLTEQYPFVSVEASPYAIAEPSDLAELDLHAIVIAIGDPTLERAIAAARPIPTIITTWLEAMGLGGHAVLDNETVGCLNCLYHRDNTPTIESATRMIASGELVSRNLTGCEGSFVPFSAVDVSNTAAMSCRLLMDQLSGERVESKYTYWRGPDSIARQESVKTSLWYQYAHRDQGKAEADTVFELGCPICRARANEE